MPVHLCRLLFLALSLIASGACAAATKPNIILAMADDLGWGDVGFNWDTPIQTPNLDTLGGMGLVFDRFYAASPVCSPTRGSCLTGRHPSRYRIYHANVGHLLREEICLADVLKEHGYVTGHFGKWHLGTLSPDFSGKRNRHPEKHYMTPGMHGFDEWFSTEYAVPTWDPYAHGRDPRTLYWHNGRNIIDGPAEGLTGDDSRIIMDKAVDFIERAARSGRPFLAVIWFHAPHQPVIAGPDFLKMYAQFHEDKQHYYGVVTALDRQMGRLWNALCKLGIEKDTMLWFCADNGPEGNPGPRGRSQGSAGPLRGRKRSLYEGGIRVPGFLVWPGQISSPRRTDVPAVTSDYFPTILDVLDIELPSRPYDGISLLPLIKGTMTERPAPIFFEFGAQAAVIDGRWKLVHNKSPKRQRSDNGTAPVRPWELYNLAQDVSEKHQLQDSQASRVERMRAWLAEWQASVAASAEGKDYAER